MFGPKNPQLRAFEELEETFTRVENVFFVLAPKEGDIFTLETLSVIENLTEEGNQSEVGTTTATLRAEETRA